MEQYEQFSRFMPAILGYRDQFISLNSQLKKTTLTGKISSLETAENLFAYMETTQQKFSELQRRLLDALVEQNLHRVSDLLGNTAQVSIDILVRNLFERTADVGFLAMDEDIIDFLLRPDTQAEQRASLEHRLFEYAQKYTVYQEILVLDAELFCVAHLDANNKPISKTSSFGARVLDSKEAFEEFFGVDSLYGEGESALFYGSPIRQEGRVIGALVLVFDFAGEMKRIYNKLQEGSLGVNYALLDERGRIISSLNESLLPVGSNAPCSLSEKLGTITLKNREYFILCAKSRGYQGYGGPKDWCALSLWRVDELRRLEFRRSVEAKLEEDIEDSPLVGASLASIINEAQEIYEDLNDVVINGEIIASKTHSYALNAILDRIRAISHHINALCIHSITELLESIESASHENLRFYSGLAMDILDRNLYERANDCRWWALHTHFRHTLAKESPTAEEIERFGEILCAIHSLYTVYYNLFVFDASGKILASSHPNEQDKIGKFLPRETLKAVLACKNPQEYHLSSFESSPFYREEPTFVYYGAIFPLLGGKPVGGIGIVFDSTPQFHAMLEDSLPRDEKGEAIEGVFGCFVDQAGKIIAKTQGGEVPPLEGVFEAIKGEGRAEKILYPDGGEQLFGIRRSGGYREYKSGLYAAMFRKV
ncbi:cache domain-containing protein [Wolinella succinogenes]|uniref:Cache domain-containing protein n=1 Tax=Wolinella succinogenes (strain ATCC 29543 / DSM 1740 / CCUG 13145 / JCM 31913 / LMG 7466 / NCTC 11488 / FDC 602W) TaxID=273121 RepID=Q7MSN1_WOLSU|nr:cache domain-containing protein [Wolinella succinogenes]CAE09436.1 hypothetical protein WS0285 [Wolinella succinogenes]VEG81649.1 Uncharacterised protein [Wolinella succinogenes]HCZ19860.1 hypothetical protein [Helicobacter sp.]